MLAKIISRPKSVANTRRAIPNAAVNRPVAIGDDPRNDISPQIISTLQQDKFVLFGQTIMQIGTPRKERPFMEIFIRYSEEDEMSLPPGTFFPILEECHMLPLLDRWVVNRLARWVRSSLRVWPKWEVPRCNVNLSEETLDDAGFGDYVRQYVGNSYLSKGALGFELSWEVALRRASAYRRLLKELRSHGCTFTLSGIDGGIPSMATLHALSPNFIKLNSVSVDLGKLVDIQRRCRVLGIKTIAEHVESKEVLEKMRAAKVDFAQGYQISPVKAL
jgi:EAL domain-containing protein (putative c-di-GMP-specific phosphodiesterase class I)